MVYELYLFWAMGTPKPETPSLLPTKMAFLDLGVCRLFPVPIPRGFRAGGFQGFGA